MRLGPYKQMNDTREVASSLFKTLKKESFSHARMRCRGEPNRHSHNIIVIQLSNTQEDTITSSDVLIGLTGWHHLSSRKACWESPKLNVELRIGWGTNSLTNTWHLFDPTIELEIRASDLFWDWGESSFVDTHYRIPEPNYDNR